MGVFGFKSFLHQSHPAACPRTSIRDLVSEYRKDTGVDRPEMVVDTNNLIRQILHSLNLPFCGVQFRRYKEKLRSFVSRFTDLGVSPVFFMDGRVEEAKKQAWYYRKGARAARARLSFFNDPKSEDTLDFLPEHCRAGLYACSIQTLKEAGCPVHVATDDCDLEMARYARDRDAFAILSHDVDFVFLRGARHYLSLDRKQLDLEAMSTYLYDRDVVAGALGLLPDHLPLLASLIRNDYLDSRLVWPLYNSVGATQEDLNTLVPALVEYIKEHGLEHKDSVGAVEAILSSVFDRTEQAELENLARKLHYEDTMAMKEELRRQLHECLSMYEYGGPRQPVAVGPADGLDPEVLQEAMRRHRSATFLHTGVLSLLTARALQMGPALEDPRLPASCSSETALRPFRQRVYGLLQLPPGKFHEYLFPSAMPVEGYYRLPFDVDVIAPDPTTYPHPGLLALWRDSDAGVAVARWRLWAWALAGHRPDAAVAALHQDLQGLPEHLVVPVSTLYLLFHSGALTGCARPALELVRLLARACLAVPRIPAEQLESLRADHLDLLEVHVAALFAMASTYLSLLNDVLGAPVPTALLDPALFFDGQLLHWVFSNPEAEAFHDVSFDKEIENNIVDGIIRKPKKKSK